MTAAAALLLAVLAADPCAPLEPLPPDPAAAAAYRAVAERELAAGSGATAAVALRAAAARDRGDAASRATLARLCAEAAADPFELGVTRLEAGDARGALRAFRTARGAAAPSPSLALLEGICLVELGEDEEATALLRAAERAPEHRDAARLYLGVLRLRAGDAAGAAALFDAAREGPGLARVASDLGRLARRDGRLVLSLVAESSWDSNVTLAPDGAVPGPEDDGAFGLVAAALWRPRGASGPYLRASGGLNEMMSIGAYDLAAVDGALGWQHRGRALAFAGELQASRRRLGGAPYLTAGRALASVVWGRRTTLSATYALRLEDYEGAYDDYSGVLHRGELRLALPLGRAARLGLAYGAARDATDADDLSFVEHGPRADLWVALGSRARLGLEAGATFRVHDAATAGTTVEREDVLVEGTALAELDLSARLTARIALHARRSTSNLDALEYEKLVPTVSLAWVAGFP